MVSSEELLDNIYRVLNPIKTNNPRRTIKLLNISRVAKATKTVVRGVQNILVNFPHSHPNNLRSCRRDLEELCESGVLVMGSRVDVVLNCPSG